MEKYYLDTLIFFFNTQKELDFVAIRDVLQIIDDDETPDDAKKDLIMDTLRYYGLNEVSYRNGQFSLAGDRSPIEYHFERIHENIPRPVQEVDYKVLNGTCTVKISQN